MRRVLQREAGDGAAGLAQEVVRAVACGEQVRMARVPGQRRHLLGSTLDTESMRTLGRVHDVSVSVSVSEELSAGPLLGSLHMARAS